MTPKTHILIVDDVPENLKIVALMLKASNYELALALNGPTALKILDENKIDLVLLDVMMPEMDGFEVCKRIKENFQTKDIPVIFLTAKTEIEDIVKGFKLGGADYISKPFKKDELLIRVQNHVKLAATKKKLILSNQELIKAKEKAEHAEKAQFEFLSTMSHEIRTPLNAVVGLTNILLLEEPKQSQIEYLSTLKFSSQNLLNIINDILDYNKLAINKVFLEQIDFNIFDIIKGMHYAMESLAKEKQIELKYSVDPNIPEIIVGDSTRLLQIINNLISNSIKFTKKGIVSIDVLKIFETDRFVKLKFIIKDTGIGIPKDKLNTIFEEFTQASSNTTREYGGTGLGLPIAKKLLKIMGSDIHLESELGKGSAFSFDLQFVIGEKRSVENRDVVVEFDDSLKGKKILLVEDNKINQMVTKKFLKEWECETKIAENGQIAYEMIFQENFDAVLMDLHMPVMDGYESTRIIRNQKDERFQKLPIIALSASALGEIEIKTKKFGMDDFLTKPFVPFQLFSTLVKHTK